MDAGELTGEIAQSLALPADRSGDRQHSDAVKDFKVLLKRWIVGRTFGWLIQSRHLIPDHQVRMNHSEVFIYLSITRQIQNKVSAA